LKTFSVASVRDNYVALRDVCYLNTGTVGLMSETVLERHLERVAHYERFGHYGEEQARDGYEQARRSVARLINANPSEIALTRNASDGVNLVLSSLDLPAGGRIVSTTEEHPAVLLPINLAARRSTSSVELLRLDGTDDQILSRFEAQLAAGGVGAAVISHVSCETGRRLPVTEMCRLCRDHGVFSLIDGAQSVGQVPVDVNDIGCDFITGNGHKWICGPKGSGFLYVRSELISRLTPRFIGDGAIDPRFDRASFDAASGSPDWGFRSDAQRFEFGTRNWHLFGALEDAIGELEQLGWGAIHEHVEGVSTELKDELGARAGIDVHTPRAWGSSCGLVTFSMDGWDGVELSNVLWQEYQIIQRRVQIPNGVRISCAHYTSEADIRRFLDVLDSLQA
jgi:selenocysteine lyase/cysteine desulfurase